MGLREEKKQKTRKAISDLATQLFMDRGYSNVTTAEIADLAEVSVPTLFKYFPTKESLVFDEDHERENDLVETVVNRKKGQSILNALYEAGLKELDLIQKLHPSGAKEFMKLVDETPELSLYAQGMWMRHEKTLAKVIKKESRNKITMDEAEAIACFVLDAYHRSISATKNSKGILKSLFAILEKGWKE